MALKIFAKPRILVARRSVFMEKKEFVEALKSALEDEFVAKISTENDNIKIAFLDGKTYNIAIFS